MPLKKNSSDSSCTKLDSIQKQCRFINRFFEGTSINTHESEYLFKNREKLEGNIIKTNCLNRHFVGVMKDILAKLNNEIESAYIGFNFNGKVCCNSISLETHVDECVITHILLERKNNLAPGEDGITTTDSKSLQ